MNKLNKPLLALALLSLLVPAPASFAEDIDIYAKPETADGSGNPNILIIVDNSANWADNAQHFPGMMQGEAELSAIRTVASELNDKVNLGLMMFTAGSGGTNKDGGYVRFKVRQMTQANKTAFSELIGYTSGCTDGANSLNLTPNCIYKNFNAPTEKVGTSKTDYSAVMFEAFKYFGGRTSPAHSEDNVAGTPVDASHFGPLRYAGNPDTKSDRYAFQAAVGDTTPSADANLTEYVTPIDNDNNCANNYIIFIGNGFPNQDSPSSLLSGVGGDTGQLLLNNLAVTTTPQETLAATTSCGAFADVAACQATLNETDPALVSEAIKAAYPLMARDGTGYDSYRCEVASACPAGTVTDSLGASACGAYASQAVCQADVPSGYDSVSCTAPASCTASIANPDSPVAVTACISTNLSNATNCNDYGTANYPNYSGFSCSVDTNCGAAGKSWTITATTKSVSSLTYARFGTKTTAAASSSFNIYGTANVTAATPTGTFSAPTSVRYADEWARFLNKTDVSAATGPQNVTTFTVDVYKDKQDQDQTKLLMSMARAGGGKYFSATNEQAIITALRKIMSEIQSVNSVFASSSLPVSVNTQGTYLNQVFMGMFRPEGSAAPRWAGNLKQYEFKIFNGVLRLADKHGNEAISSTTGFVTPCAASFWSTDTGDYWNFPGSQANGDCTALASSFPSAGSSSIFSDWPDGEVVEKGGAAQQLRGVKSTCTTDVNGVTTCTGLVSSSQNYNICGTGETPLNAQCRKLLTCDGSSAASCTTLTSFDTSNATVTSALSTSLIEWVRGKDVDNENGNVDAGGIAIVDEMRPSVHGGVVHSQPAVVDYGGSTGVVAIYGADDGVFHAVKGNQEDTDGAELWGFIAPETYGRFNRLRDNGVTTPLISFPADPVDARPTGTDRKDYFFDGSTSVYQKSGTVWIYAGMRRGGRAVYAFDASDPTNPSLKWRRGCFTNDTTNDTSCSTGWAGIGQTWSKPIIAYLPNYVDGSGNPKPVVIFGGGYDTCEDNDSPTPCSTPSTSRKGAQVWFVDADTGAIIRIYPVSASTPGDISLLVNSSGYATHVYVSDINGDIYRINVGTFNGTTLTASSLNSDFVAAGWSSNTNYEAIEIAQLSEVNHARKFINGPNVVPYAGYNAILIGSGDREHPLVGSYACNDFAQSSGGAAGTYVKNQFYMIKDSPNAYPASPITPSGLTDVTTGVTTITMTDPETGETVPSGSPFTEALISENGWRFDLGACEQAVNRPLTVAGTTYFGTNTPTPSTGSSCFANLGIAKGYAVDFTTGNPIGSVRSAQYVGGGMPPSPVAGVVDVDGTKLPFIIGGIDVDDANASALQGSKVEINPTGERFRSFWYIQND